MKEIFKKHIPSFSISSWYVLILSALTAGMTFLLLSIYGAAHWSVLSPNYQLKAYMENVSKDEQTNKIIKENEKLRIFFSALPDITEKINKAGWSLLGKSNLYHLTGLVSFILALLCFFCRPRWVGLIALPFGVYSILMAMITM